MKKLLFVLTVFTIFMASCQTPSATDATETTTDSVKVEVTVDSTKVDTAKVKK